ncbi:hypothetical protein [Solibacillus cecembensis]|uniref:hypothetical protein n=1 Tax=Solibacillus cecembensis TaxID=459347 RepID=UPI003CFCD87F
MTAKINIALDDEGKYVKVQDAVKRQKYFCLNCAEALIPNKGEKNIHYYRHFTKKGEAELIECELYLSNESDYGVLMDEQSYENKIRFVIDESLNIKIKLPSLDRSAFVRMDIDNLYFSIQVQNNSIYSTDLGSRNLKRYLDVTPEKEYNIEFINERKARLLEYEIVDKIQLFSNKTLLFKKSSGEFINISYLKTNLSDEFFLLSLGPLNIHSDLILKNDAIKNGIYMYHLFLENLTDQLINWFEKDTNYTIVPNRKWIDLIYPNCFQYSEYSTLVETEKVILKVTPSSIKDRIVYLNATGEKEFLLVDENGHAEVELEVNRAYDFHLNHVICNELRVMRVKEILLTSKYAMNILNKGEAKNIAALQLSKRLSIESKSDFQVFLKNEYPFWVKNFEGKVPEALHFPFIGTIYRTKKSNINGQLDWELILSSNQYLVVKNSEYTSLLKWLKSSDLPQKPIYIAHLLKHYNKLPKEMIKILRGGGLQ